jgi:hypothetical protein
MIPHSLEMVLFLFMLMFQQARNSILLTCVVIFQQTHSAVDDDRISDAFTSLLRLSRHIRLALLSNTRHTVSISDSGHP